MHTGKKISKGVLWTSYILQIMLVGMFLMGALSYLLQTERAIIGAVEMGYPKTSLLYLGVFLFSATILYSIPKTTFVGGLFLTAYLGGAVATHIIHNDPILHVMSPVIFGILIWPSIWLRDEKLTTILFFNKKNGMNMNR